MPYKSLCVWGPLLIRNANLPCPTMLANYNNLSGTLLWGLPNSSFKENALSETSDRCRLSVRLSQAYKQVTDVGYPWDCPRHANDAIENRCNLISLFRSLCFLVFKMCGSEISDFANTTVKTVAGWSIDVNISEQQNRKLREKRWGYLVAESRGDRE